MADTNKKYVKKLNIGPTSSQTEVYVQDEEAVHTINGYDTSAISATTPTVYFANERIDETTDIDPIFTTTQNGGNN